MGTDPQGREVNFNENELSEGTSPGGGSSQLADILVKIYNKMEESSKKNDDFKKIITDATQGIGDLSKKLDKVADEIGDYVDAAKKMTNRMRSSKKSSRGGSSSDYRMFNAPAKEAAKVAASADTIESKMKGTVDSNKQIEKIYKDIGEHNRRWLRNMHQSQNFFKEQIYDAIKANALGERESDLRKENLNNLRRGMHIKHQWRKVDQSIIKQMETMIVLEKNEENRNKLVTKYNEMVSIANDRVAKNNTIWGQLRNKIMDAGPQINNIGDVLGKAAESALKLSKATQGFLKEVIDVENSWGRFLKESIVANKEMERLEYTLGRSLDATEDYAKNQEIAARTGFKRAEFEEKVLKISKMGIKEADRANKITKTSLKLARDIGVSTDETTQLLGDWSRKFNMSGRQAEMLGRYMREVSFHTGLAGEELMAALKTAEKMNTVMRNMGLYSAETARNIIDIAASGEKFGVGEEVQSIMDATSNIQKFSDAGGIKNLLALAGDRGGLSLQQLTSGEMATDKGLQKQLAGGMEQFMRDVMKKQGVAGAQTGDLDKLIAGLSSEQRNTLNAIFTKDKFGVEGIGGLNQTIKSFKESSMTFSDKMKDINKDLAGNLGSDERLELSRKRDSMAFTEGMKYLERFGTIAKDSGTTQKDILDAVQSDRTSIIESLSAIDPSRAGSLQNLSNQQLLNELGKVTKAGPLGDPKALVQGIEDATKAQDKKETELSVADNALLASEQYLKEINDSLRTFVGGPLTALMNFVGPGGIAATYFASSLAQWGIQLVSLGAQLTQTMQLWRLNSQMKKNLSSLDSHASRPGSIYTNDMRSRKAMQSGFMRLERAVMRSGMGGGGFGGGRYSNRGNRRPTRPSLRKSGMGRSRMGRMGRMGRMSRFGMLADFGMMFGGGMMPDSAYNVMDTGMMAMDAADMAGGMRGSKAAAKGGGMMGRMGGGMMSRMGGGMAKMGGARFLGPALKGLGAVGRVAGKAFAPLAIAMAAFDGVTGAMNAASNAANIFGVEQDKVTTGMKVAAGAAGGVTGVLNGLTFGFFEGALGPDGTWTKGLSNFFHDVGSNFGSMKDVLTHLPGPVSSLANGFYAMNDAAKIFGVEQDKVTTGMKVAAGAAGSVTGVMNGLTLGFFEESLGPEGTWTKSLAGFFHRSGEIVGKGWEGVKTIFSSYVSTIQNVASGVWGAAKKVGSTALNTAKTVGSGIVSGAKAVGGGIVSGTKAVGSGIVSGAKAVGGVAHSAWEGTKSAASYLNPYSYFKNDKKDKKDKVIEQFQTGANQILESGLAYLHKGEMVVPSHHAEVARSDSKFGVSGFASYIDSIKNVVTSVVPKIPGLTTGGNAVESKLRAQRAGSSGDPTGVAGKDRLDKVEANTKEMKEVMEQIQVTLDKFVQFITSNQPNQSSPTNEAPDPRSNRKPRGNANFYTWNEGSYFSNPTKGPVTSKIG